MLPKHKRFTRKSFPKGRPTTRRSFLWGTVSVYEGTPPRFGVVVSKKVLKKAHKRNRARRRVYSVLSKLSPKKTGLIYLRKEALTTPLPRILKDVEEMLAG